jgi:hypothetical protein
MTSNRLRKQLRKRLSHVAEGWPNQTLSWRVVGKLESFVTTTALETRSATPAPYALRMDEQEFLDRLRAELQARLKRDGLSVNAFAAASGLPQQTLNRFLTGDRGLTLENTLKIVAALGLTLELRRPGKNSST